jgi:acyl-CoA dehydrogenase
LKRSDFEHRVYYFHLADRMSVMSVRKAQLRRDQLGADMQLTTLDLKQRVEAVAAVAAAAADDVDRSARFPAAAVAAMRDNRLFGLMVPAKLGGEGLRIGELAIVSYRLGQSCAATAMTFAMHHSAAACIIRHSHASAWHKELMRRIATEQLLVASSTTEGQGGGNVRASVAPIETDGDHISLIRAATVISYGAEADIIATTARRSDDAASSDQVLATFIKSDYVLEPLAGWDTLGMRGTSSAGFTLKARGRAEQILPESYDRIHSQTMQPVSHLLWASVWAGIAADAVKRAQNFIRKASRQSGGALPPGAAHFTKARSNLQLLLSLIAAGVALFEASADDPQALSALDFQTAITLTKVDASELALAIVLSAMRATGLAGYRNDGEFSIGRHLRDVLSAPIMINNDRILANVSMSALMSGIPSSLGDNL